MDLYNIHYKPHSTWFFQELKKEMPNLNATKIGTKNYVSLNTKTVQEAKGILKPYTLLENDGESSGGNTTKTEEYISKNKFYRILNKELAVPVELLVLLNLLIVGNSNEETFFH